MEQSTQLNIPISFEQLKILIMQLSQQERAELVSTLTKEDNSTSELSNEQILANLESDLIAYNNGTLKTRPIEDLFNEI